MCRLADGGDLIEQRLCTEPAHFAAVLGGRPRGHTVGSRSSRPSAGAR
jgi:hypothetical protein